MQLDLPVRYNTSHNIHAACHACSVPHGMHKQRWCSCAHHLLIHRLIHQLIHQLISHATRCVTCRSPARHTGHPDLLLWQPLHAPVCRCGARCCINLLHVLHVAALHTVKEETP